MTPFPKGCDGSAPGHPCPGGKTAGPLFRSLSIIRIFHRKGARRKSERPLFPCPLSAGSKHTTRFCGSRAAPSLRAAESRRHRFPMASKFSIISGGRKSNRIPAFYPIIPQACTAAYACARQHANARLDSSGPKVYTGFIILQTQGGERMDRSDFHRGLIWANIGEVAVQTGVFALPVSKCARFSPATRGLCLHPPRSVYSARR